MSQKLKLADLQLVKVTHQDLKRLGIVKSRYDQHLKIKAGRLRPPIKEGGSMQAAAWWWWEDIREDLERERAAFAPGVAAVKQVPLRKGGRPRKHQIAAE